MESVRRVWGGLCIGEETHSIRYGPYPPWSRTTIETSMWRLASRSRGHAITRNGRWLRMTHSLRVTYPYEGRKELLADWQGSLRIGLGTQEIPPIPVRPPFHAGDKSWASDLNSKLQERDTSHDSCSLTTLRIVPSKIQVALSTRTPPNMETRMDYHAYPWKRHTVRK